MVIGWLSEVYLCKVKNCTRYMGRRFVNVHKECLLGTHIFRCHHLPLCLLLLSTTYGSTEVLSCLIFTRNILVRDRGVHHHKAILSLPPSFPPSPPPPPHPLSPYNSKCIHWLLLTAAMNILFFGHTFLVNMCRWTVYHVFWGACNFQGV